MPTPSLTPADVTPASSVTAPGTQAVGAGDGVEVGVLIKQAFPVVDVPVGVAAAVDIDGPPSNRVTGHPMGPITQPLVDATAGEQSVQLSWTETDCGGRPGPPYYQVVFKAAGGVWELGPLSLSGRITTISGLVGGVTYEFSVVAVCGNGESSPSGTATATPAAAPDPGPGPDPSPGPGPGPVPGPPVVPSYTG